MGLQNIFPSPYGEQAPLLALENIIGGIIMEETKSAKQIESVIVQAFLSYFYAQKLLNNEELLKLKNCLNKQHIKLAIITLKSDVCNGGTSQ